MSKRYPGGIISKTPPTVTGPATSGPLAGEGGTATGVWTLADVLTNRKIGIWPTPVLPRVLYVWGSNTQGRVGDETVINRSSPVQIGSLTTWYGVSGTASHTPAIKTDGTFWAWGQNLQGALGDGTVVPRSSPIQIGALTNWSQVGSGSGFTAALKSDGSLWTWGYNANGQLGSGTLAYRSSPVQVGALLTWAKISVSSPHVAAIKTDGTLWTWGVNSSGGLGDGTIINRSSPVQVGTLTNWSKSSTSDGNSTAAIKTDGTLWGWGNNSVGGIGDNTIAPRSSPVQIGALTDWSEVSVGFFTVAVKNNGTLWTWGNNANGGLGDGTTINRSSPVQVGALTNWFAVSGATVSAPKAIKTNGTLWGWGLNTAGVIGDGTVINRSSPVQIGSLTNWSIVSGSAAITKG